MKEDTSEVVRKELNLPSMKQTTKSSGLLELASSDSTAFDENSTSTMEPLLVKEDTSEVVTKELNVPSMKQATKSSGFLELVFSDSTAFDENRTNTMEPLFNEADHNSSVGAANVEICEKPETSVDKFPCMSAKSALLLSQEETHDYHPNSPMLESCERKKGNTFKLYRFTFGLLHSDQAITPWQRRLSQAYDSAAAAKSTPPPKNEKASSKGKFFALVNGVKDSTCSIDSRRRLITPHSFRFARRAQKMNPKI